MKVNELSPGMQGTARTVFRGYKVEEFPVEIIDIVIDQGMGKKLILIKAGGEKIEEIGGIASGMSGSPVYINDKLIGAIAYGWNLSDHRYCLLTPIEDMLELLSTNKDDRTASSKIKDYQALKTPLYISGMRGRSFERMKSIFEDYGFEVLQNGSLGSSEKKENPYPLSPGSAVAVQLVRGDINIASIGTITHIDGRELLAFGHPFFNKGEVEYLLSEAYVNTIIPSLDFPFKLASVTDELLGSIKVDRGAGVAGELRNYPKIIPLRVRIRDKDRNKYNEVTVQMVKDEDLLSSLMINVSLEAIDSTLDRIGKGSGKIEFKITGKGLPDLSIERENVFYSRNDIAALVLTEFYNLMDIITFNPFQEVNLIDVQLDIEIEDQDNVALIQEARVLNETITPGDELEVELTLKPYRKDIINKRYLFQLPDDIETGTATLAINGGYTWEYYNIISQEEVNPDQELNQAIASGYKDLEPILEDFLKRPLNNEVIMQIYPGYRPPEPAIPPQEESSEEEEVGDDSEERIAETGDQNETDETDETKELPEMDNETPEKPEEIKEIFESDYILEGNLTVDISIEEAEGNGEAADDKPLAQEARI
ncbi:MAG TPA: SpoIVB peptidase S55 domain-containing protein [Halanaerobiales bacterium]|nr:SpoIVB peptidase S55 domain-containing protein [Halanaerobiales bacterium]